MTGPEGKLFKPLAFTKTFCLFGSVIVALTVLPPRPTSSFRQEALAGRKPIPQHRPASAGLALGLGGICGLAATLLMVIGANC